MIRKGEQVSLRQTRGDHALVTSGFLLHRKDWYQRDVCRLGELIGLSRLHAFAIRMRVVTDSDAVSDRPIEAGRQQNVGAGEPVAHQELPFIGERDLDMLQLVAGWTVVPADGS